MNEWLMSLLYVCRVLCLVFSRMMCNPDLRDRETRGVIRSSLHYVFPTLIVDALRKRVHAEFGEGKPDVLYSGIDPSGGGEGSDYAIFTMAIHQGCITVSACCQYFTYFSICCVTKPTVCTDQRSMHCPGPGPYERPSLDLPIIQKPRSVLK